MRVAVIGATGRTGERVVEESLHRGDEVIAIARDPERVSRPAGRENRLRVVAADVRDAALLGDALQGADAVVSALGTGGARAATDVYPAGARSTIDAMHHAGIARLVAISAAPAGPRDEQAALERRLVMPALERFFGALYTDMRRMEAILAGSDLEWVVLRPPRLRDTPASGGYRLDTAPLPRARTLSFADLASALLDALERPDLARRAAYVAE